MSKIFLIPGLGADSRLFDKLELSNPDVKVIEFVKPLTNELLEEYAIRLGGEILHENKPVIIGVSLGGIIAQELSKSIRECRVIIISSIRSVNELPGYLTLFKSFPAHQWISCGMLKLLIRALGWMFTTKSKEEKKLFLSMAMQSDCSFMKWAIDSVLRWQVQQPMEGIIQIHGDQDRLFPIRNIKGADFVVSGGQHFMIVQEAKRISSILNDILEKNG